MSTLCWNCRGAGNATTVRELREFARKFAPTVLCIVETQISGTRVEARASSLGYDKAYAIDSQGRSGGIGLFWNNTISVEILGDSVYHVDAKIEEAVKSHGGLLVFTGRHRLTLGTKLGI